jgi:hypothetical protein
MFRFQLLRLLHIAFDNVQHPAAEKLYDFADEDDVVDTLLKRRKSSISLRGEHGLTYSL